jgi:predicted RNA-binding protein YlxR (DUF448 family)
VRPVRSCVGCGCRAPQAELVRFTWRDQAVHRDGLRRAPGRGAYLHPRPACWDAFVTRRGPVRSLRVSVPRVAREALVRALRTTAAESEA